MNRFADDFLNALREALDRAKGTDNCIEHRIGDADGQTSAATFVATRSEDGNAEASDGMRQISSRRPKTGLHEWAVRNILKCYVASQNLMSAIRRER